MEDMEVGEVIVGFLDDGLNFQIHKSLEQGDLILPIIKELKDELVLLGSPVFSILVVFRFTNTSVNVFSEMSFKDLTMEALKDFTARQN